MTTSLNDGHQQNDQQNQSYTEVAPHFEEDYAQETNVPQSPMGDTQPAQQKLLMWLIVTSPDEQRGMVLPVVNDSVIGRHGDITWHDPRMSRQHARFTLMDDPSEDNRQVFGITPEKDRNGTVVNGRKIKQLTPLRENDVIQMGSTRFIVKVLV